jgi:hypothetical protein
MWLINSHFSKVQDWNDHITKSAFLFQFSYFKKKVPPCTL